MQEQHLVLPDEKTLTYDRYLKIDELLSLQKPQSDPIQHDEYLFIIIHQVYELWFKQILLETELCFQALKQNNLSKLLHNFQRIKKIQDVLIHQISILETMTPHDFNKFRDRLNPASGFQSYQFRVLEFKLGAKNKAYLNFFRTEKIALSALEKALQEKSLYDEFLIYLHRKGFSIPKKSIDRDYSMPYESCEEVSSSLVDVYKDPSKNYDLYMCMEAMLDIDENFLIWRFRHVAMVERMIGFKRGTGGSSGASYLQGTLTKRFFPELWNVRNQLGDL